VKSQAQDLHCRTSSFILPTHYLFTSAIFPQSYAPNFLSLKTPTAASESVSRNIAQGTDIVKLFTGSIVSSGHVVRMPLPIARAGAEAGHASRYLQVSMYSLMLLKSQPE
jgi:hypothetical protein